MGKFKFLIRKGGYCTNDVNEKFDFMLVHYPYWNDNGYYIRFHLFDKYGSPIAYHMGIICSYQGPGEVNKLIDFDVPYKIIDGLSSTFVAAMNVYQYYNLCHYLPKGEDRKEFADSLRIMHYGDYWNVWDSDCFQKGWLRNRPSEKAPWRQTSIDVLFNKLFKNTRNFYDFKYHPFSVKLSDGNNLKLVFGPRRIAWINDVVKENATKTMYDVAMSLYLHATNKNTENPLIEPTDAEINKVIFVSYKSFLDDCQIPQISKKLNIETTNTYCYIGLQSRFDLGEYEDVDEEQLNIDKIPMRRIDSVTSDLRNSMISDKIKNWDNICAEYASLFSNESLEKILKQINVHMGDSTMYTLKNFGESNFKGLDYKHKLFIHCLGMIGRNIQPYSVILLDRPDMFFDTKQMSFLLSTLYDMCEKMDSCVIINTKE